MQKFVGISLKTRLYLLVLAAFIPVAILIVYVAKEQKTIETDAILNKTMLLAQAAADAENQQLEATRNLLAAVAAAFHVVDGQPERLSSLTADLLGNAKGYAAFGIVDPAGHLLAGSDPSQMEKKLWRPGMAGRVHRAEKLEPGPVSWRASQRGAGGLFRTARP